MRAPLIAALALAAAPALAGDIEVSDAYVRAMGTGSGAAYFTVTNHGAAADRLLSASADPGERAELHNSKSDAAGMMQMLPLDGINLPAGAMHSLTPGADHLMLFGLPRLEDGATVTLTLIFEQAGQVRVDAPVDNARKPGVKMEHSRIDHGKAGN